MAELDFLGNMNGANFGTGYAGAVYGVKGLAPALTTMQGGGRMPHVLVQDKKIEGRKDNLVLETVKIKQATEQGFIEMELGGVADLSYPNSKTRRGRVQENGTVSPTLTASNTGILRIEKQAIETLIANDCEPGDTINPFNKTVDKSGICPTITTRPEGMKTAILPVISKYRIRKLTPLECFRLMGVTDSDAKKMLAVNSNSQCYKQAGNSIVVDVMAAMFKRLF